MGQPRLDVRQALEVDTARAQPAHVLQISFTLPSDSAVSPENIGRLERPQLAGRVPRSYRRPDALILDAVVEALASSTEIDGTELELACAKGVVSASGTLGTRTERLLLEALVVATVGVVGYDDKVVVTKGVKPTGKTVTQPEPAHQPMHKEPMKPKGR